jgi:hypothetical protein
MKNIIICLCVLLNTMMYCNGHIFMNSPPSRRNKYSEYYVSTGNVDYNIMAPLNIPGYKFPCKGFPKGPSTKTIDGKSVHITLEGSAIHGGGHCQFGITYDDNNFLVLKTIMMDCILSGMSYTFDVPDNTPSGEVTVFWTWVNKIGNREYYMECADILIKTNNDNINGELSGKELLVVNLPGYPTIPEFAQVDAYNGTDLFNQRKDISIMPLSSSVQSQPSQPSQPSQQPQQPQSLLPQSQQPQSLPPQPQQPQSQPSHSPTLSSNECKNVYIVKAGDTCWNISLLYNVHLEVIVYNNPGKCGRFLAIGTNLCIDNEHVFTKECN